MVKLPVLLKKLGRTILTTRGQFISLVLVVSLGIMVYISMATTYANLYQSKDAFYRQCKFGDHFYEVIRAPEQITRQIAQIPGVEAVSGRIVQEVPVIRTDGRRASVRLYTYPLPLQNSLNQFYLLSGRQFNDQVNSGTEEVLVDKQYYQAHQMRPGSTVTIVANGRKVLVSVVGAATSPDFSYPVKDAATIFVDPVTFGIKMMSLNQAQPLLGMPGQVNQLSVKLTPGADREAVNQAVKNLLAPYGNLGDYPQKDQLSNAMLDGELKQLKSQAVMLPTIFLIIAVLVQYVMLGRLIKTQRLQIGVMKAIGYSSRQIIGHYAGYSIGIGLAGALLGSGLGILLAGAFSDLYAMYFNLPYTIGGFNYAVLVKGVALSLGVAAIAGIVSTRGVVRINPAEAMRPEPPQQGHAIWLEGWPRVWQQLSSRWKMSLRAIGRNRRRFIITLLGVICAVGLLVTSIFFKDIIGYMRDQAYFVEQRYDVMVRFKQPQDRRVINDITRLSGVIKAESVMEVPVKFIVDGQSRQEMIQGLPEQSTLRHIGGLEGQILNVPEDGILISALTADKLGLKVGDRVQVETKLGYGPERVAQILIVGVNKQVAGSSSFASLTTVNRLLGEGHLVSGVMLKTDPGSQNELERSLAQINGVAAVVSRDKDISNFDKNLETMAAAIVIMVTFALLLGFAIIYNSSIISFAEREREMATLRVLGMRIQEVSSILSNEVLLYGLLGIIVGLPVGRLMAGGLIKSVSTDLYQFEAIIYPSTYFFAALMALLFIAAGHFMAVRGLKRLDLVEVLKNRD